MLRLASGDHGKRGPGAMALLVVVMLAAPVAAAPGDRKDPPPAETPVDQLSDRQFVNRTGHRESWPLPDSRLETQVLAEPLCHAALAASSALMYPIE